MITIEIENATEIAAGQSFWARALRSLAPSLIARKVDERVVENLREVFAERGIRARFTIIDQKPASPRGPARGVEV